MLIAAHVPRTTRFRADVEIKYKIFLVFVSIFSRPGAHHHRIGTRCIGIIDHAHFNARAVIDLTAHSHQPCIEALRKITRLEFRLLVARAKLLDGVLTRRSAELPGLSSYND